MKIHDFFESTPIAHFVPFLKNLDARTYIICDLESHEYLTRLHLNGKLLAFEQTLTHRKLEDKSPVIVVVSPVNEKRILNTLKHESSSISNSEALILGLLEDIYPYIVGKTGIENRYYPKKIWGSGLRDSFASLGSVPPTKYAILCCPRSGSHFLCDLLTSVGLGRPKEHTKSTLVALLKHSQELNFSSHTFLMNLARVSQENNIFGTKIVSHDLEHILEFDQNFLKPFDHLFHLERKDKVMQAISLVRAKQKGIWHLRSSTAESNELEYDFSAIMTNYKFVTASEAQLSEIVRTSAIPSSKIFYEDVVENTQETVKAIGEVLRKEINKYPNSTERMIRQESDYLLKERFIQDCLDKGIELQDKLQL